MHYFKIFYTFYFNSRETNYILNFQQYYMLLKNPLIMSTYCNLLVTEPATVILNLTVLCQLTS